MLDSEDEVVFGYFALGEPPASGSGGRRASLGGDSHLGGSERLEGFEDAITGAARGGVTLRWGFGGVRARRGLGGGVGEREAGRFLSFASGE